MVVGRGCGVLGLVESSRDKKAVYDRVESSSCYACVFTRSLCMVYVLNTPQWVKVVGVGNS